MIVIADTTPLNHLILIEQIGLLQALYGRVIVPRAVLSELQAQATPPKVKAWISNRPTWLEVNQASFAIDPGLARLDPGEHDAFVLAQELGADLLLMDDLGGRFSNCRRARHARHFDEKRQHVSGALIPAFLPHLGTGSKGQNLRP